MPKKRSQAAIEYLMVAGFAFIIVIPMMYILYQYTSDMSSDVSEAKIGKISTDIVNTAEQVFYLGAPSRTTLRFEMPEGVTDIEFTGDNTLTFSYGDVSNPQYITTFSNVQIYSYLTPTDFAKGRKNLKIEAESDHVSMYTGNKEEAMAKYDAYSMFKMFMENAGYLMGSKNLITRSGNRFTIDTMEHEEDVAYLYAMGISEVDVAIDVTIEEIEGDLNFFIGNLMNPITGKISINPNDQLAIEFGLGGFLQQQGIQPTTANPIVDASFDLNKKYRLNFTTSPGVDCVPSGLCGADDTKDYFIVIVQDENLNEKISEYIEVNTFTPMNVYFGDYYNSVKLKATIEVDPAVQSLVQTHQILSDEIVVEDYPMPRNFTNISMSGNRMMFIVNGSNELSIPISFTNYYPVSFTPNFEDYADLTEVPDPSNPELCDFTFTKTTGVQVDTSC